jgi:hypothetical protein
MAHRYQFIGPEMSRCTGLHADQTGWDVGKKGGHLCPSELFVEQPFSVLVNPMDLENVFCQIDSSSFNVHDSSAPFNE